ncbi:MAG TPA: glutamate formimidoyltransferase [Acidobacteriota bacterium]|jgi:glutamate formiminotransferase
MPPVVECVPNFSEGRDQNVIDRIVAAISDVPQAIVLHQHKDAAHHRSVITFAGTPASVEEAAVRATGRAAQLIDLSRHQGAHPRLGATDVIPFVPIRNITLQECAQIARRTGKRIARDFGIPVYLYEAAANRPERKNLADIRRGEFEQLRDQISTDDSRVPDFGERKVHPTAGATVVGAREVLIAFNVFLQTEDLTIAKDIARAVRFSSGGLEFVRALGLPIPERRQTQVSMNLTNYRATPIQRVFDRVREEAASRRVQVASTEIVGLVPQEALIQAAANYLQVENFSSELVLENRLEALGL